MNNFLLTLASRLTVLSLSLLVSNYYFSGHLLFNFLCYIAHLLLIHSIPEKDVSLIQCFISKSYNHEQNKIGPHLNKKENQPTVKINK